MEVDWNRMPSTLLNLITRYKFSIIDEVKTIKRIETEHQISWQYGYDGDENHIFICQRCSGIEYQCFDCLDCGLEYEALVIDWDDLTDLYV